VLPATPQANLYGTTWNGGAFNAGAVYKVVLLYYTKELTKKEIGGMLGIIEIYERHENSDVAVPLSNRHSPRPRPESETRDDSGSLVGDV
jgi:hypothetical protein